ncbi:hypothetical protein O3M35_011629 [Rhynocoris fuscipes]|uniref:Uncharacterized protein n=1 Tax=Rhynocoris fuscipes TaxID=488301 RepID=A0AAW1CXD9_9HEMI
MMDSSAILAELRSIAEGKYTGLQSNDNYMNRTYEQQYISLIKIREKIKENYYFWNDNNDRFKITVRDMNGNELFTYRSDDSLETDIQLLCTFYTSIRQTFKFYQYFDNETVKELICHFVEKYDIDTKALRNRLKNDSITLLRIARCFPNICCENYAKGLFISRIPLDIIGVTLKNKHRAILCPLFPSVASNVLFISKNTNILPQLLWIYFNIPIRTEKWRIKNFDKIWFSVMELLNADIFPEEYRFYLCHQWDLIDKNGKMNKIWKLSREYCLKMLDKTLKRQIKQLQ